MDYTTGREMRQNMERKTIQEETSYKASDINWLKTLQPQCVQIEAAIFTFYCRYEILKNLIVSVCTLYVNLMHEYIEGHLCVRLNIGAGFFVSLKKSERYFSEHISLEFAGLAYKERVCCCCCVCVYLFIYLCGDLCVYV